MKNEQLDTLQKEWMTLQNSFDHYEKVSLLIKLFNILLTCYLSLITQAPEWAVVVCAVIWLQDGIWKTFQARTAVRLEQVEQYLAKLQTCEETDKPAAGMQFNSMWAASRKGAVGLVTEYLVSCLKPTVAYPHLVLLLMAATVFLNQ